MIEALLEEKSRQVAFQSGTPGSQELSAGDTITPFTHHAEYKPAWISWRGCNIMGWIKFFEGFGDPAFGSFRDCAARKSKPCARWK
jgi:hypothetical protein